MPPSQSSEPAVSQKRTRAEGDSEEIAVPDDLKCQICLGLLDDAVQTPCCGALCCRSCIDTWLLKNKSCISCRFSPIKSCDLQRDVIRDRLSAAHPRPCAYVYHGCIFVGRRAEVSAHEKNCECIPRSVKMLQDRVAHLEATILSMQQGGEDDNLAKSLQHIHGFAQVCVHDRTALQNGVQKDLWHSMAFSFKPQTPQQHCNDVVGELVIKESNFNVSVCFRKFGTERYNNQDMVFCVGDGPLEGAFALLTPQTVSTSTSLSHHTNCLRSKMTCWAVASQISSPVMNSTKTMSLPESFTSASRALK